MAFERIGLGGVLTMDSTQFVRGTKRGRDALGRFTKTINQRVNVALDKFGSAMRTAGVAMLPATLVMYKGVKTAATFEQAIADLGAVSRASAGDLSRLSDKAKEMGIVTAFSASESASAMEQLARAGATVDEQISGVRGVLDLAAAGNVQYAQASEIVATITKSMGREFATASNLADILALAAAKSNVTVQSLGEAFRYGAPQAKTMGIRTEELTAIFGKLGDAGIKGSMAGTSFTAMLVKLSKPSRAAEKLLRKFNITLTDSEGQLRPMAGIVGDFKKALESETDAVKRARMMTELFGVRGQKAYAALASAGKKSLETLTEELHKASDGLGAATEMAQARLNTLIGSLKMMAASIEGLSIEVFAGLSEGIKDWVKSATTGLNNVLRALSMLKKAGKDQTAQQRAARQATKQFGETATAVAQGILDAIKWMKEAWDTIVDTIKMVGRWLGATGKEGVRSMVALIGKIIMVSAVAAPVALALGGIAFVITKLVIPAITFMGVVLKRVFTTWGAVLLVVAKLYMDVTDTMSKRNAHLDYEIKKVQARTALRARTASLKSRHAWEDNMHGASRSAHAAFGDIGSDMEAIWKQMEGMTTDLEGDLTDAGNVNVQSMKDQTKSAVEMATTAAKSYEAVVNEAERAAPAAGDAWREAAGDVVEAHRRLTQEERKRVEESTGLVSVFADGWGVLVDTGVRWYELLGGVTERIKQERLLMVLLRKEYEELVRLGRKHAAVGAPSFIQAWIGATQKGVEAGKAEARRLGEWNKKALEEFNQQFGEASKERRRKEKEDVERKKTEEAEREKKQRVSLNIKNTMCIDGREVSSRVSKHQHEVLERDGAKTKLWQRRMTLEHGAMPVT